MVNANKFDHKNLMNITGRRYGRLIVLRRTMDNYGKIAKWDCVCDCGKEITVLGQSLRDGSTSSCGCLKLESIRTRSLTHGASKTIEYTTWNAMKNRCSNPKTEKYPIYGGRGITVCSRWINSFENFYADMGPRPSLNHSLDRKNPDGNYEPSNCRWATSSEQARNRRNTLYIIVDGHKVSLADELEKLELDYRLVHKRMSRNISFEEAVSMPKKTEKKFTIGNESKTVKEWATDLDRAPHLIYSRLERGMTNLGDLSKPAESNARILEFDGKQQSLTSWAREYGLKPNTLDERLKTGMSLSDALIKPTSNLLTLGGKQQTTLDWAKEYEVSPSKVYHRLKSGKSLADALDIAPVKSILSDSMTEEQKRRYWDLMNNADFDIEE